MINVSRDGKQIGHYSVSEINKSLASGTLLETDWAWYDGAADWVQITEVEGVTIGAENSLNKQDAAGLRKSIRDFDAPMKMNEFNFNFKSYCKLVLAKKSLFGLPKVAIPISGYITSLICMNFLFVEARASDGFLVLFNLGILFLTTFLIVLDFLGERAKARQEERGKKLAAKIKEYNAAYHAYMTALDGLEREDAKENRIAALEKGRTVCAMYDEVYAMYHEFRVGEPNIPAVNEQSLTNDIIARWGS